MRLVFCLLAMIFMQQACLFCQDSSPSSKEERFVAVKKNELFDFILNLGEQHVFTPAKLSSLTGIPLLNVDSGPFFSLYFSPDNCIDYHSYIKKIELRSPVDKKNPGGLIIIDLYNTEHVTGGDVVSRFGQVEDLGVPSPEQPADAPINFTYKFIWGKVSFGISKEASEALIHVVLDAYESKGYQEYKKAQKPCSS